MTDDAAPVSTESLGAVSACDLPSRKVHARNSLRFQESRRLEIGL